jgi:hypothetical protein
MGQLANGGAIRDAKPECAKVTDIVDAVGGTVRTVAAPESRVGIEPEAWGVVIVKGTAADEGGRANGVE